MMVPDKSSTRRLLFATLGPIVRITMPMKKRRIRTNETTEKSMYCRNFLNIRPPGRYNYTVKNTLSSDNRSVDGNDKVTKESHFQVRSQISEPMAPYSKYSVRL